MTPAQRKIGNKSLVLQIGQRLFKLRFGPDGFELLFNLFGLLFAHTFLDWLRCLFHQSLGFLQAKPCDRTHFFDFGAFYNTNLDELLKRDGIDHIIMCGVTTQCCVHSTLREAVDRGYWCLTIADCCAASEPGMHEAALSLIAGEGHLFGWVADAQDVVDGVVIYDSR